MDEMAFVSNPRRVLIDVRSLSHFATHGLQLTGIQRVEWGIAGELAKYGHQPVVWDEKAKILRAVEIEFLQQLLKKESTDIEQYLRVTPKSFSTDFDHRKLSFYSVILSVTPPLGRVRKHFAQKVAYLFGKTYRELSLPARKRISERLKLGKRHERMRHFLAGASDSRQEGQPIDPKDGDIFLSISTLPDDDCIRFLLKNRISIVPFVYDLYPILQPHLVQHVALSGEAWRKRLAIYSREAPHILTCSDRTKRDLIQWFSDNDLAIPKITAVPLAPGLNATATRKMPDQFPFTGGFALLVGSFGPNKNQAWAHMLWSRFIEQNGDRTIPLVLAGRAGWRANDTIESIRQDRSYGRFLHIVEEPGDEQLAWLYANCSFLIQPSEIEGWGLPVSESLEFGKPCLTSGRGALAESSQGLAWQEDPLNGKAWLEKLTDWTIHPEKIIAEQARVSSSYVKRGWDDVSRDILDVLNLKPN